MSAARRTGTPSADTSSFVSTASRSKLRINGGDELTATGDGPFTFNPIDDETPWVVTLSGRRAAAARLTAITAALHDASSTLAGANVDDVLVTCDYLFFVDGFDDPQ